MCEPDASGIFKLEIIIQVQLSLATAFEKVI